MFGDEPGYFWLPASGVLPPLTATLKAAKAKADAPISSVRRWLPPPQLRAALWTCASGEEVGTVTRHGERNDDVAGP